MFNIDYELNEKIHATIINPYLSWDKLNNELQVIYKRNHGGYGLIQSK